VVCGSFLPPAILYKRRLPRGSSREAVASSRKQIVRARAKQRRAPSPRALLFAEREHPVPVRFFPCQSACRVAAVPPAQAAVPDPDPALKNVRFFAGDRRSPLCRVSDRGNYGPLPAAIITEASAGIATEPRAERARCRAMGRGNRRRFAGGSPTGPVSRRTPRGRRRA